MAAVTIRNLPDEIHRGLKHRARKNGRSTEAEIRAILQETVNPPERIKIGTELRALGRELGITELDIKRDPSPIEAAIFE